MYNNTEDIKKEWDVKKGQKFKVSTGTLTFLSKIPKKKSFTAYFSYQSDDPKYSKPLIQMNEKGFNLIVSQAL